jgi:hypothetical protein
MTLAYLPRQSAHLLNGVSGERRLRWRRWSTCGHDHQARSVLAASAVALSRSVLAHES